MKRIKFILLFAVIFASFSVVSCSSDDSGSSNGITTGNYWPMEVNNQWTYKEDGVVTEPMRITGTDVFGGTTYYRLYNSLSGSDEFGLDVQVWITKKGATYYNKMGELNFTQDGISVTIAGAEMPILKDDLPAGGKWSGSFKQKVTATVNGQTQTGSVTTEYTGTILEKDVTEVVNGEAYTNVIKANLYEEATFNGEQIIVNTEFWYAKDVGPIKSIATSDGVTSESILVDYILN